jgi:hypothetical protein
VWENIISSTLFDRLSGASIDLKGPAGPEVRALRERIVEALAVLRCLAKKQMLSH